VALCCPKNWTPIDTLKQLPNDDLLVSGYQTPEGKPAAFVFTFYAPRSVENLGEQAPGQKPVPEAVTWAKTLLVKGGWMKGAEVFADYGSPGSCDTTSPSTVLYKHWVTTEGVRHVGIVVNGAAPPRELCLTLDSMANLYKPVNISTSVK